MRRKENKAKEWERLFFSFSSYFPILLFLSWPFPQVYWWYSHLLFSNKNTWPSWKLNYNPLWRASSEEGSIMHFKHHTSCGQDEIPLLVRRYLLHLSKHTWLTFRRLPLLFSLFRKSVWLGFLCRMKPAWTHTRAGEWAINGISISSFSSGEIRFFPKAVI